ncbi:hypothetical protein SEUCBS140593_002667 [Sporothrix eucalyptigena]|uniref:Thioesterase domain-containing protein n=1 Tax=Sporothrix eucalyptigena TaxID=1812306 RepID=A0ABP0B8J7_9PEZI
MASKARQEEAEAARAKAMLAVQAIFDRWNKVADHVEYQGFELHVMRTGKVLDASLGPPSSVYRKSDYDTEEAAAVAAPIVPGPAILATSTCSLYVDGRYSNMNGVMHGGGYGVIFDMMTTTALGPLARPGFWDYLGGVSRTLNISYLKPCPLNSTVIVHAHVYHVGRTMALIKGWMTSEDGQTVYATCDHHKVAMATPQHHLVHRVKWDEQWEEASDGKDTKGAKL